MLEFLLFSGNFEWLWQEAEEEGWIGGVEEELLGDGFIIFIILIRIKCKDNFAIINYVM